MSKEIGIVVLFLYMFSARATSCHDYVHPFDYLGSSGAYYSYRVKSSYIVSCRLNYRFLDHLYKTVESSTSHEMGISFNIDNGISFELTRNGLLEFNSYVRVESITPYLIGICLDPVSGILEKLAKEENKNGYFISTDLKSLKKLQGKYFSCLKYKHFKSGVYFADQISVAKNCNVRNDDSGVYLDSVL